MVFWCSGNWVIEFTHLPNDVCIVSAYVFRARGRSLGASDQGHGWVKVILNSQG